MEEKLNVRLGNPVITFFWSATMFLAGTVVGVYWRPPHLYSIMIAIAAGVFTMLHELVCCFVWCSMSAWWIGRRMGELRSRR